MTGIFFFFEQILVPFIFAIGLIYYIYGIIEYFFIGKEGDEEKLEHGRELLLKASYYLFLSLIIYGVVLLAGWVSNNFAAMSETVREGGGGVKVEHERGKSYLPVPNLPNVNQ